MGGKVQALQGNKEISDKVRFVFTKPGGFRFVHE
jgi:hypothetical protein